MRIFLTRMKTQRILNSQFFRFCALKKYTKEHEWVSLENDIVTVGITEYAQAELGEIVHVELPKVGTAYNEGDTLGAIESVKTAADIFNPVPGIITEANEKLVKTPKLLNTHPYSQGWYAKLKVDVNHGLQHLNKLMTEEEYLKLIESQKK